MASSDFVRDILTKWDLSQWIKNFEEQEIDKEGFLLLEEKDFIHLIPKIGPRTKFAHKHKLLKEQNKHSNVDENFEVATSSTASIKTAKSSSGNSMPSTSVDKLLSEKRKHEVANANMQRKKQKCMAASIDLPPMFDSEQKAEVKKIMQRVRGKLDRMPSTKLTDFLRSKIDVLDEDRKEMVGVFGKTGAGKSSLINAILGKTKLLPSGNQGACTSVMIQVEANMINEKYIAEIEFITVQDWKDELWSILRVKSGKEEEDEDKEIDVEDGDEDYQKIKALYGKEGHGKNVEELMDKKLFEIPEFYSSCKKKLFCDTAEELSKKIACYVLSDSNSDTFERMYWPLVKCLTIKVPNCKDLLEHVVLVDLPGNGDCNKSRDTMWKSFIGNCSVVWIVSDISRAISEKESWEILDSTVSLFGPGGECRSISFICTKTDDIEEIAKDNARSIILTRNEITKKKVREKFNKQKDVKKHFSDAESFKVFTVSSKKYNMEKQSELDEKAEQWMNALDTEIPHLQKFLRNLNDHHTRTSDYISGVDGILSLMQAARNNNNTDSKEEVCQVLEQRLEHNLKSIVQYMEKPYNTFDQCLSKGVQQSEDSCETLMNKVWKSCRGQYGIVRCLCENNGIYKPKGKKNKRKEINVNESLASCMRSCIDEEFTYFFPNDKCGPIRKKIEDFTLDTNSLVEKHKSVSLHLKFLNTEEKKLKTQLIRDLLDKKKQIYFTLPDSIKDSMHVSYTNASMYTGKGSLQRMKDELHLNIKRANVFWKAKKDMMDGLTKLKDHMVMHLKYNIEESIRMSLHTPNSSFLPDVTEDYNKIRELMVCSSTIPVATIWYPHTEFQCQTVEGQTNVQEPRIITSQHIRRPTYRLQFPEAGLFQCGLTGLVFEMAGKGDVCVKMSQWDTSVLGSMTPAGPLFSISCPAVLQLHLPHCMCDDEEVLSVAHFTGGTMEIVKPLKTTASHVVVNIPNPSLVGLIRCGLSTLPVQSRVLLFLCPQGNTNQNGMLNVFLLPKNVPTFEVIDQQKGSTFIQTSSECTLSPGRKYGLCCELVDYNLHLKSRTFHGDFSPNFLPTFQVNLECISDAKNMNLTLLDRETNDQKVWECVVQTG
ncbi:nuclear GTPase SLIP-GC-like isoform X1 [Esox lucius]|nr:nuclear GTPase SLIP-GC-like isoform X1 [Esox lucius]